VARALLAGVCRSLSGRLDARVMLMRCSGPGESCGHGVGVGLGLV
jgi:hypothetical protein